MFTGLVELVGKVLRLERGGSSASIVIEAPELAGGVREGDSVAVNGVCLTTVALAPALGFDMVTETLSRTTLGNLKPSDRVNMELSLKVGDRLGGHFVQGHVDGTGTVARMDKQSGQVLLTVTAGEDLMRFMVAKGSVAVDGVSLTVAATTKEGFSVALVPFTLEKTTLGGLKKGQEVNIETDIIGKYVRAFLAGGQGGSITESFLREHGFC